MGLRALELRPNLAQFRVAKSQPTAPEGTFVASTFVASVASTFVASTFVASTFVASDAKPFRSAPRFNGR